MTPIIFSYGIKNKKRDSLTKLDLAISDVTKVFKTTPHPVQLAMDSWYFVKSFYFEYKKILNLIGLKARKKTLP